jgi:hypothetical protein
MAMAIGSLHPYLTRGSTLDLERRGTGAYVQKVQSACRNGSGAQHVSSSVNLPNRAESHDPAARGLGRPRSNLYATYRQEEARLRDEHGDLEIRRVILEQDLKREYQEFLRTYAERLTKAMGS